MNHQEKVCIITGANSGIGKATALKLVEKDMRVVMLCRNEQRGKKAQNEIKDDTKNDSVDLILADLAEKSDVYSFCDKFREKYDRLDILINNAGILTFDKEITSIGVEKTFMVNYLSHFLLTSLLLDTLKKSAPSRIINVTSSYHKRGKLEFSKLDGSGEYHGFRAYARSKLALVLFTYQLDRKLKGYDVTVNALHPGLLHTNIMRHIPFWARIFTKTFRSPEHGAEALTYLATSDDVNGISGKYFSGKKQKKSSKRSYKQKLAEKLWNESKNLLNLNEI